MNKSIVRSISLHALVVLGVSLFIFSKDVPSQGGELIQVSEVRVVRGDSPRVQKVQPEPKVSHQEKTDAPAVEATAEIEKGLGEGERNEYIASLIRLISQYQHYPKASILNEEEGVVQITVNLGGDGRLLGSEVSKSSGFSRLDEAALKTIRQIAVFPMPARQMSGLALAIPIRYDLTSGD